MFTIGVHRWLLILRGERPIHAFPATASDGPDWYRRSMRAHANCVENLPVFGAIVVVLALCMTVVLARLVQSSIHVAFRETARSVSFRFSFFAIQLCCMLLLASQVALAFAGPVSVGGPAETDHELAPKSRP